MKKILIIDDDLDMLETTGALLEFEGFEIHSADTVEEGIDLISQVTPDLILLDIMFPEKKTKGVDAAGEIRARFPDLPIFAFTAVNRQYAFEVTKEEIRADEFLNKPIKTDLLVDLINRYLG